MDITRSNIQNIHPLSPMQEGMFFHNLAGTDPDAYCQQISWRIAGELDLARFEASWNALLQRHDILRSVFTHQGADRLLHLVLKKGRVEFSVDDLTGIDATAQTQALDQARRAERARGFDLSRGPLMRIRVARLGEQRYDVLWSHHHIVMDGWSLGIVLRELLEIYGTLLAGGQPSLPPPVPFVRYIKWIEAQDHDASQAFWESYLAGYVGPTRVPVRSGTSSDAGEGAPPRDVAEYSFAFDEQTTAALQATAARLSITLSTLLMGLWGVLLGRYNDTSDVVFGAVVSGRPPDLPGVERMVGNFINTIPVRIRLDREQSLAELLQATQRDALSCEPHHHHSLARIRTERQRGGELLGTVMLFENYPLDETLRDAIATGMLGIKLESADIFERTHYDFVLAFEPGVRLLANLAYDRARHDDAMVRRLGGHLRALVRALLADPGSRPMAVDILGEEERARVLALSGLPLAAPPRATILERFAGQVAEHPDRPAVLAADHRMTYRELDAASNRVAAYLVEHCQVQRGDRVALLMERGAWTIAGALGVLKAAAAYVPIDAAEPSERVAVMIADVGCSVGLLAGNQRHIDSVRLVDIRSLPDTANEPSAVPAPDDLAYVIYTSGSTGVPKGVMIEHRAVVNLVDALARVIYHSYPGHLTVALLASVAFDASVQQIFAALLQGHSLLVIADDIKRDSAALTRVLVDEGVDIADCTPTLLALMSEDPGMGAVRSRVRHLLVGGEALPGALVRRIGRYPGSMGLTNVYGPTECCVDVSAYRLDDLDTAHPGVIPLGRPLDGLALLVLDRQGALAPMGVAGEIHVAGASVGRGYVTPPARSPTGFVEHPLAPGVRVYRTGDLGRWNEDGLLEFLGRDDEQVKIRGHRIEYGEIDARLSEHPAIRRAAVVAARDAGGHTELRAFIEAESAVDVDSLRAYLSQSLPRYMLPERFIEVDALPVTVSGKVDRKALLELSRGRELALASDFVAPATAIEEELAAAFRAVLRRERIGVEDDFFSLGGDSIKAIQIVARLARAGWQLEVQAVLQHPTIRSLAPHASRTEKALAKEGTGGPAPLGVIQMRFLGEHLVAPARFNHELSLRSKHPVDPAALRAAARSVWQRHDALRLRFHRTQGQWLQEVVAPERAELDFAVLDLTGTDDLDAALQRHVDAMHGGFDLAAGSLLKMALVRADDGDRLVIVAHHLAVDGLSWQILLEDLLVGYQQRQRGQQPELPPATASYIDWARALHAWAASAAVEEEAAYWQAIAAAQVPPLAVEHPDGSNREMDTVSHEVALSEDLTGKLMRDANRAFHTTAEDLLLTALARALWSFTNHTRVLFQKEGHGRVGGPAGLDVSRTVGWFTSIHPVLIDLPVDRDLGYQLKSVKETLHRVPHGGVDYNALRYIRGDERVRLAREPEIRFNYLGELPLPDDGMSLESKERGRPIHPEAERRVELDVSGMVVDGRMMLAIRYSGQRFAAATIERLAAQLTDTLTGIVEYCTAQTTTQLTPSDLTYKDLSIDELEGLF